MATCMTTSVHGKLVCRCFMTGEQLGRVLGRHPDLRVLTLRDSACVTDKALEALPAHSLKELTVEWCPRIQGMPLSRLKALETLRFDPYCEGVTKQAMQVRPAIWALSGTHLIQEELAPEDPVSATSEFGCLWLES